VSGRVLSILARDSQRSSMALFQPQVLDEDPRNESDAARNAKLVVQTFEMRVDSVGGDTEVGRDSGFLLIVEHPQAAARRGTPRIGSWGGLEEQIPCVGRFSARSEGG
jgi:hypothetical protein